MIDFNDLAIADVLIHPEHGLISHQPGIWEDLQDKITVRDISGKLFTVLASECEWASEDETKKYWKEINGKFYEGRLFFPVKYS